VNARRAVEIAKITEQIVPVGLAAPSCQDNADDVFCCSVEREKMFLCLNK
jgi:hypothetical protein